MKLHKNYLLPRILIGLMALVMLAATLPAYGNPTSNPGLINLSGPALSLGETGVGNCRASLLPCSAP